MSHDQVFQAKHHHLAATAQSQGREDQALPDFEWYRGNKYVMIVYDYDSNAILSEPLTARSENK